MATTLTSQYLALFHLDSLPGNQFSRLIKQFGSIRAIAEASTAELSAMGLDCEQIEAVRKIPAVTNLPRKTEQILDWLACSDSHQLVCYEEVLYPSLLREINCPPPVLFLVGNAAALLKPQLAIVGSRHASTTGKQIAFWLAKELASRGFGISSGLAAGIDSQAHRGALSVDATTVAVMGTGADRIYPQANSTLAKQIQCKGALISEFNLGSPPAAAHFPRRNRIISGMSLGVIVVEAALKSGSLITARQAMEQCREVFAVPGAINNPLTAGCHRLIRDGAKLVDSIDSILEELDPLLSFQLAHIKGNSGDLHQLFAPVNRSGLGEDEITLLKAVGFDGCHMDTLVMQSKYDVQTVNTMLMGLEVKGFVSRKAGRIMQLTTPLQEEPD
ncbi:MAG: DNA-protecting protein DprA [Gammaproteobacteria bacterium]|nr:DNA-protecting protein DprA [Gammaproteobacteria bacterium]